MKKGKRIDYERLQNKTQHLEYIGKMSLDIIFLTNSACVADARIFQNRVLETSVFFSCFSLCKTMYFIGTTTHGSSVANTRPSSGALFGGKAPMVPRVTNVRSSLGSTPK